MRIYYLLFSFFFCFSCKEITPRKPINQNNKTFYSSSIDRNLKIKTQQESLFKMIIEKSKEPYYSSNSGFWYKFLKKNYKTNQPESGDKVTFSYKIEDVNSRLIYDELTLGEVTYIVDKEDILPALREGIKVLSEGEIARFLFPSFLCYSYTGDGEKISINQPLIITINLLEIIENN